MVTTKSLPFGHIQIINSRIHLVYTEMLTVKRQFKKTKFKSVCTINTTSSVKYYET